MTFDTPRIWKICLIFGIGLNEQAAGRFSEKAAAPLIDLRASFGVLFIAVPALTGTPNQA
jgi:hypothetical protein